MNPDVIIILTSGITGMLIGGLIGLTVAAILSSRAAIRAEKHAWAAANLYYSRKEKE